MTRPVILAAATIAAALMFAFGLAMRRPCPEPPYVEDDDGVQPSDPYLAAFTRFVQPIPIGTFTATDATGTWSGSVTDMSFEEA